MIFNVLESLWCKRLGNMSVFRSRAEGAGRVNGILHGRRVIGRSAAGNSVVPRIEDGLVSDKRAFG